MTYEEQQPNSIYNSVILKNSQSDADFDLTVPPPVSGWHDAELCKTLILKMLLCISIHIGTLRSQQSNDALKILNRSHLSASLITRSLQMWEGRSSMKSPAWVTACAAEVINQAEHRRLQGKSGELGKIHESSTSPCGEWGQKF